MAGPDLSGLPPSARAAFAALQQQFRSGLAARWAAIEAATDLAEQAQALHKLAGAAGSYGYPDLSQAARTAERLASAQDTAALHEVLARVRELSLGLATT